MFNTKSPYKSIPRKYLFLICALLGAVIFVCIYGVKILDCTNNGWLFYSDVDLRQHYIAWCNYRSDPWHFPIGLIDSLSYPYSMSVIYTDSIPLFAVIFKLFRAVLPVTFQYFGLFGIMSFMLMGGLSAILLSRFSDDPIVCILGSVFFVMSFPVLQRMYYHTALGAQWIIVLALILWVFDKDIHGNVKKIIAWSAMGFLCVAIHSYFLPMVGMIMLATMIQQYISCKEEKSIIEALKLPISEFAGFCILGIANLWVLGGFYGESGAYGGGLGSFGANLNTFINPIDYGKLLPRLPLYYDFQFEGMGYLGCGILFLYMAVAAGIVFRMIRKVPESAFHTSKLPGRLTLLVVLCSILSSTLPLISIGSKKIIWFPYPGIVEKVLGIFRSNGRFIWVAVYILIAAAIAFTAYTFRHNRFVGIVLIVMALILQVLDASDLMKLKYEYSNLGYPAITIWDDPELLEYTKDKEEFIFLYNDNDITLLTAYYGYLHNMRQNNYYYARDIDSQVSAMIDGYIDELKAGQIRDDAVYVATEEMYQRNPDLFDSLPVSIIHLYDHVIFIGR